MLSMVAGRLSGTICSISKRYFTYAFIFLCAVLSEASAFGWKGHFIWRLFYVVFCPGSPTHRGLLSFNIYDLIRVQLRTVVI